MILNWNSYAYCSRFRLTQSHHITTPPPPKKKSHTSRSTCVSMAKNKHGRASLNIRVSYCTVISQSQHQSFHVRYIDIISIILTMYLVLKKQWHISRPPFIRQILCKISWYSRCFYVSFWGSKVLSQNADIRYQIRDISITTFFLP
jgi:hypothetical protein